jgi:hypothetical protein
VSIFPSPARKSLSKLSLDGNYLIIPVEGLNCKRPTNVWRLPKYTVKKAVELLDASSKNTFLKLNKYDSIVEIIYLDTHVFFSPLCNRMRKFDIREVQ